MICAQQLLELQELYNSQQLLTAELSDKLEKTEVKWPCITAPFFCSELLICSGIKLTFLASVFSEKS